MKHGDFIAVLQFYHSLRELFYYTFCKRQQTSQIILCNVKISGIFWRIYCCLRAEEHQLPCSGWSTGFLENLSVEIGSWTKFRQWYDNPEKKFIYLFIYLFIYKSWHSSFQNIRLSTSIVYSDANKNIYMLIKVNLHYKKFKENKMK